MNDMQAWTFKDVTKDVVSGAVVFLVALPLCLGIALACDAPLFAGLLAGIVGGIIVGILSGSHTSVAGPAAGLTAVVAAQIATLGSFQAFLLAVLIAGLIQIILGIAKAGFIADFFPTSVIKGLLAAIGIILILKQIPHALGQDADPEGDMAFFQPDEHNTFSEIAQIFGNFHPGAAWIGLASLAMLLLFDRIKWLKNFPVPPPLIVVVFGVVCSLFFRSIGAPWEIQSSHLVQVPVPDGLAGFFTLFQLPDFSQWNNSNVYIAALTLAAVASLETLLNLEAVDKLDPRQRTSPPSRELLAQGVGNVACGLLGGLPVTSVIVRSSVNINAGGRTKLSAIVHGCLLLFSVLLLPTYLNTIPLSCLAAILLHTGIKLASPSLFQKMWAEGRYQFIPFVVTLTAIVLTDLLIGILIGLAVAIAFILNSNLRRPVKRTLESHLGGDVLHIELANQVSFLNRAALCRVLDQIPRGGHVLLDAQNTDYIDPDILGLIRTYKERTGPARGVDVSMLGFRKKYQLDDHIQFVDYSTRELQSSLTPSQVLKILKEGHTRFRSGARLSRDLGRLVNATADSQHPLAVVISCMDSRNPAELIFDLGVGDIFSVRVAGNVLSRNVLGSVEYGCGVVGAKLIVVMGHTRCGAVNAAVDLLASGSPQNLPAACQNLDRIIDDIQQSVDPVLQQKLAGQTPQEREAAVNEVAKANVQRTAQQLLQQSKSIGQLVSDGKVGVVGAMYDVTTGVLEFISEGTFAAGDAELSAAALDGTWNGRSKK